MIELKKVTDVKDPSTGALWSDETGEHVISEEGGRFHVRAESGAFGAFDSFAAAFDYLTTSQVWGEVTLAPANRLRQNIEVEDECDAGNYLLEYLATYGTAGIDAQALAKRVFERIEEV